MAKEAPAVNKAWIIGLAALGVLCVAVWNWHRPRAFDVLVWKSESATEPGNTRLRMVQDLLERHALIGKTKREVTDLLEEPTGPHSYVWSEEQRSEIHTMLHKELGRDISFRGEEHAHAEEYRYFLGTEGLVLTKAKFLVLLIEHEVVIDVWIVDNT